MIISKLIKNKIKKILLTLKEKGVKLKAVSIATGISYDKLKNINAGRSKGTPSDYDSIISAFGDLLDSSESQKELKVENYDLRKQLEQEKAQKEALRAENDRLRAKILEYSKKQL